MDPIKINVNINVELGERTMSFIQQLAGKSAESPAVQRKPAAKPETKPAPAPETKEDPKPAEAPAQQDTTDDLPFPDPTAAPAAAPAPATEDLPISDEERRQVVFAARKAKPGNPREIKNVIFPEFGIKTSMECPLERRAELVARLNKLIA